ncbi:MAG: TOBE domain-containing protein [Dethiobacter sp.]|nr:TOBE domain-containing protein [Dethiobacter sp.]MBS4007621.1 TOBE domain-containing protein [Clostridium sp.]
MKTSAKNQLKGKITGIEPGAVNALVTLDIGGGNIIYSTITMESVKNLGLKVGGEAYALIKASSVIIGVDH